MSTIKIGYREHKVRRPHSQNFKGDDKFTGAITYQTFGSLNGKPFRLSLGAEEEATAKRRTAKIERAVLEGAVSPLWAELADSLPQTTFKFFAGRVGYTGQSPKATAKLTWQDLVDAYEIEMQRKVDNKDRGATRNEGIMSQSTRDRYRITIRDFTNFLEDKNTGLIDITPATITKYKVQDLPQADHRRHAYIPSSTLGRLASLRRHKTPMERCAFWPREQWRNRDPDAKAEQGRNHSVGNRAAREP